MFETLDHDEVVLRNAISTATPPPRFTPSPHPNAHALSQPRSSLATTATPPHHASTPPPRSPQPPTPRSSRLTTPPQGYEETN
jgi:hypothetical protein